MKLNAFFYYFGSKNAISNRYPAPAFKTIIEPFAGAAGYSCLYPDHNIILNDLDPVIYGIWHYLINVKEDEFRSLPCEVLDYSELEGIGLSEEAKLFIRFNFSFGRTRPSKRVNSWSLEHKARRINGTGHWCEARRNKLSRQLQYIRHWKISCKDYKECPDIEAMWFIDPPYIDKGRAYSCKFNNFDELSVWCESRLGQVIVCEQYGATWLDFKPLGEFAVCNGMSKEVVYLKGKFGGLGIKF